MKDNKISEITGIILAMLGFVLYKLLKGSNIIIIIIIIIMIVSIYQICKLYKISKILTYDSMSYMVGILMGVVAIFYELNFHNCKESYFIPISIFVLAVAFIIIGFLKVRKSGDKEKIKLAIISGIGMILLLLLMGFLVSVWS